MNPVTQLWRAMEESDWTTEDVEALCEPGMLSSTLKNVRAARSSVVIPASVVIDCDSAPSSPSGFKEKVHRLGGQLAWRPAAIKLYQSPGQRGNSLIRGHDILRDLEGKQVLNANVLYFLLRNQHLIPPSWNYDGGVPRKVFFFGTLYNAISTSSDATRNSYVLCLCWSGLVWYWGVCCLDDQWEYDRFAAFSV